MEVQSPPGDPPPHFLPVPSLLLSPEPPSCLFRAGVQLQVVTLGRGKRRCSSSKRTLADP